MRRRLPVRLAQATLGVLAPLVAAAASLAFFSATGAGAAQGSVATIIAPTNVVAQQTGSVSSSWTAARLSSGGSVQGYRVNRSDGTIICGSPTLVTTLQCTDAGAPAGTYSYTVTAIYNSWKASTASAPITVLAAPSLISTPANPSANTSPTIAFGGGGTGVSYQCALDSTTFTACTSPQSLKALNANTPLAAGAHTFKVQAVQGRSTGPDISYAWTINTTAPTITAQPTNPSLSASATFSFSHPVYASFKCQLDNGGYRACTSPTAYTGLSSGWHTFQVKASDAAGADTSPASYSWFVIAIFPGAGTTGQAAGQTAAKHTKSGVTELSVANGHGARASRRQGSPCEPQASAPSCRCAHAALRHEVARCE